MQSFKSFLTERVNMIDQLEQELRKHGYVKFKHTTKTTILTYVPASERGTALQDIAKKIPGSRIDKSPTIMRKISSLGGIKIDTGPYAGMLIGIKPDKSGGLKTDEQETLAGIFIITKFKNSRTKFSFEDLETYGDANTTSAHKIADLYEKAGKGWINSSTIIANTFVKYMKRGFNYTIHQRSASRFENAISKRAQELIKQSGHRMGIDKWNPADIWIVKDGLELTNFDNFKTMLELNEWVLEKFNSKEVMGVSLKQVGTRATVQVYNDGVKEDKAFSQIIYGKSGFANALSIDIEFDGGSMVVRNFGRPESVSGEINGKFAQGGKVGSGPLFNIIKRIDPNFQTKTHQEISQMYESDPMPVYKHLYDQMKKLDPTTQKQYTLDEYTRFVEGKSNTMNYIISRWQTSDIAHSINAMTADKKNELVNAALGYASSSTEISSIFYKVS